MPAGSRSVTIDRPLLLAAAAPAEVRAILDGLGRPGETPPLWSPVSVRPDVWVLRTGVGKSDAAGAAAAALASGRFRGIVNFGIAGALPGSAVLPLGSVVIATSSVFADEGLASPEGFRDLAAMGFAPLPAGMAVPGDERLAALFAGEGRCRGGVATVSTCSGTDALAAEVVRRTGAIAEAMEGAAIGLAAARLETPFAEVRVISNTTGDRSGQRWDLAGALRELSSVIGRALN